jgi:cytochrome oxidase complex assembly protein 1
MTVDYTQPQQYTPPQPQPPAQQKSSGCLKIFLIGCGVLIVLGVAFCAVLVFIVFAAIKKSDVYEGALNRVRADQRVIAALGEPISPGFWVSGNVNINNGKGNADFSFPISGSKGSAKVHAVASTEGRGWEYSELVVTPSNGPPINVLTP